MLYDQHLRKQSVIKKVFVLYYNLSFRKWDLPLPCMFSVGICGRTLERFEKAKLLDTTKITKTVFFLSFCRVFPKRKYAFSIDFATPESLRNDFKCCWKYYNVLMWLLKKKIFRTGNYYRYFLFSQVSIRVR